MSVTGQESPDRGFVNASGIMPTHGYDLSRDPSGELMIKRSWTSRMTERLGLRATALQGGRQTEDTSALHCVFGARGLFL